MPEGQVLASLICIFSGLLLPMNKLQLHLEKRICYQYVLNTGVRTCHNVLGYIRTGMCEHTSRILGLCFRAEYEPQW